ncbi:MAG: ATP-binding protein [Nitrosarchaeum sp.]|nr:ATP-binding protein [Nitrosarchaeum sp.]
MYDIIIGRSEKDRERFGTTGCVLLGKHYVKMGQTESLSSAVYLDVLRSHVVFVCGKRGGGKSYTMGVMAEGMALLPEEIRQNLAFVLVDTMGIYWTMKYPNQKDADLLEQWGMKPDKFPVKVFTPQGLYSQARKDGIPTDAPFSLRPSELGAADWVTTFGLASSDPVAVLIERVVGELLEVHGEFSIENIIDAVRKAPGFDAAVKDAALNRFVAASKWGLFDVRGTPLTQLVQPGQVTVLDISGYSMFDNSWSIKSLVTGMVAQKLFVERMRARKLEEYKEVHKSVSYFSDQAFVRQEFPLVWLVIDEAHEFLPREGQTLASNPLITILREGRQPGISLVLASQQPGKMHTDVLTQSDTVIAHRITARIDTDALGALMQSYMRSGLDVELDNLPREKGAALVFDDTNEKLYPIRVRPRVSWHGGEAPTALHRAPVK